MMMFAVFYLVLLFNFSAVRGLSMLTSPESSVERRAFVSKSLPLIVTGFGLPNIVNAATNTEGFEDGPRGLKYKVIKPPTDPNSPSPQRDHNVRRK